jgi:hypothetical protein
MQLTKLFIVAPDICESCVWNLFHVTLMVPRILELDFWEICAPLIIIIVGFMGYTTLFCIYYSVVLAIYFLIGLSTLLFLHGL